MATKQIVDIMVLVTADSDFIPAMKFARKEGIAVAMMNMGNPIYWEVKAHADILL